MKGVGRREGTLFYAKVTVMEPLYRDPDGAPCDGSFWMVSRSGRLRGR